MKKQIQNLQKSIDDLLTKRGELDRALEGKLEANQIAREAMNEHRDGLRRLEVDIALGRADTDTGPAKEHLDFLEKNERRTFQESEVLRQAVYELSQQIKETEQQLTTLIRKERPSVYGSLIDEHQHKLRQAIAEMCAVYVRRDGIPVDSVSPEKVCQLSMGSNRQNVGSTGPMRQALNDALDKFETKYGA